MGIGVSLLLQFSLTPGGYRSVGRSRRCSRGSIPRNIPKRSWKKPHPQLCSLQGSSVSVCPASQSCCAARMWHRKQQTQGEGSIRHCREQWPHFLQRKNRCWNVVAGAPWPWARPRPDSFLGPPRSHPRPWGRSPAG
ncbi:REPIN1 isoform 10 [Pan troglodytes]|uniref:REPIN1 isoform 10 n=3 Tax=Pan TaxID=9596 RepID=A0A6D2VUU5_PANTR|nr:REPIN1 isoform 3 [Pan troglodytes]PNI28004.1 REPIN1 isoform 10 [Pan troglodytes]